MKRLLPEINTLGDFPNATRIQINITPLFLTDFVEMCIQTNSTHT